MKIIIAGGSGFIGRYLSTYFSDKGNEVVVLSRGASESKGKIRFVHWDGKTLSGWERELEGADVLINLSGKSVAIRYTEKNKQEIYNSRIDSTRVLNKAVVACENPPKYWFNSSGASMYKTSFTQSRDEYYKEWEDEFLTEVVLGWEDEFFKNPTAKTHKIALRTSVVLGESGETYEKLNLLSKIGLGGRQGSGKQIMSWIHLKDFVRIILFCMQKNLDGVINMASPNPVSNAVMMKVFREVNRVPIGIPTPTFLLKIGAKVMGIEPGLILKSYNVVSKRLDENGFVFQFPDIKLALADLSK
jgi:uncharacterized protein (TIGR01777 family)